MSALTNTAENMVINWLLTTQSVTRPTAWYVGLFSDDPGEDASGTELTGEGGYARQSVTFSAASGGATANTGAVTFGAATGSDWPQATHFGIFTALTGGTLLLKKALDAPKTIAVGDTGTFAIGAIDPSAD